MGILDEIESFLSGVLPEGRKNPEEVSVELANRLLKQFQAQAETAASPLAGSSGGSSNFLGSGVSIVTVPISSSAPVPASGTAPDGGLSGSTDLPPGTALYVVRTSAPPHVRLRVTLGTQSYDNVEPGTLIKGSWTTGRVTPMYGITDSNAPSVTLLIYQSTPIAWPNSVFLSGNYRQLSYVFTPASTNNGPLVGGALFLTKGMGIDGFTKGLRLSVFSDPGANGENATYQFNGTGSLRVWGYTNLSWSDTTITQGSVGRWSLLPQLEIANSEITKLSGYKMGSWHFETFVPFGKIYVEAVSIGPATLVSPIVVLEAWG